MERQTIKPANYQQIKNFAKQLPNDIQGTKLRALFSLIEKKGEPVTVDGPHKLQGAKALEIAPGEYIAIVKTSPTGKFYPCVIHTYLLTTI